jgi:hypothetical protein
MRIMSAVYQRVRHRLCDDWAFGNGENSQAIVLLCNIGVQQY